MWKQLFFLIWRYQISLPKFVNPPIFLFYDRKIYPVWFLKTIDQTADVRGTKNKQKENKKWSRLP